MGKRDTLITIEKQESEELYINNTTSKVQVLREYARVCRSQSPNIMNSIYECLRIPNLEFHCMRWPWTSAL